MADVAQDVEIKDAVPAFPDLDPEILAMTADEIRSRARLIENEMRFLQQVR